MRNRMLAAVLLLGLAGAADVGQGDELRLLIDVSGSMKVNDPNNLRAPAVRLLVGLLEEGTRVGFWTYGERVKDVMPVMAIDTNWKSKARHWASQIHSRELLTDIESALVAATADWNGPPPEGARHLILLTDGMVDVSSSDAEDQASRTRILQQLVPKLQNLSVKVHAIALSENTDSELLQRLAEATDGWYEQVNNADGLHRVFLRMFEKATQRETLPLEDNSFSVDPSIRELSLLVFRKAGAQDTSIRRPDNQEFDRSELPANVRWHHEKAYDLITVTEPQPGKWHVVAEIDPDNRVMVVTNLALEVQPLPNNLNAGSQVDFRVHLSQNGQIITRPELLQLLRIELSQNAEAESEDYWEWALQDDGLNADQVAGDGVFTHRFWQSLLPGEHELRVLADGITFQREYRQRFIVHAEPVSVEISNGSTEATSGARISAVPNPSLVQIEGLVIDARVFDSAGRIQNFAMQPVGKKWLLELSGLEPEEQYRVALDVQGKSPLGQAIERRLAPIHFTAGSLAEAQDTDLDKQAEAKPEERVAVSSEGANWWMTTGGLILFNGLLGVGIYFSLRRRRHQPMEIDLQVGDG